MKTQSETQQSRKRIWIERKRYIYENKERKETKSIEEILKRLNDDIG